MMTEKLTTIARPYAQAAFERALATSSLAAWEEMLQIAARIVQDKAMMQLLNNPGVGQNDLVSIIFDILTPILDNERKNFISLLAEYDRLLMLPEIADLYAAYRAEYEKTITVRMTSATAVDTATQKKFADALTKHLKRKVDLRCDIDESLIGGAIIHADAMVIDGSVRGKLNRLLESL